MQRNRPHQRRIFFSVVRYSHVQFHGNIAADLYILWGRRNNVLRKIFINQQRNEIVRLDVTNGLSCAQGGKK